MSGVCWPSCASEAAIAIEFLRLQLFVVAVAVRVGGQCDLIEPDRLLDVATRGEPPSLVGTVGHRILLSKRKWRRGEGMHRAALPPTTNKEQSETHIGHGARAANDA